MTQIKLGNQNSEGMPRLSNRCTPEKLSLLDLPLEVRLQIYCNLFDDAVIEIRWSTEGNNRRDHWFVCDRNLSRKFITPSKIRPHIWRPRTQILATCKQIREEIISCNSYHLELNYVADGYYESMQRHLTPFLWSHITTISQANNMGWVHCHQQDLRPPLLKSYYNNAPIKSTLVKQISDKFNGLCTIPYICYSDMHELEAVKHGEQDEDIFALVKNWDSHFTRSWSEISTLLRGAPTEKEDDFAFYTRVKVVILPTSIPDLIRRPGDGHPLWYWLYPTLVLLAKWCSQTEGEIVERHWRDDADTENVWECLTIDKEKCSCCNTYCSTTMDNEQYCEDWFGNVTGPPAWREPRAIEDEIYPEGYCLFEN